MRPRKYVRMRKDNSIKPRLKSHLFWKWFFHESNAKSTEREEIESMQRRIELTRKMCASCVDRKASFAPTTKNTCLRSSNKLLVSFLKWFGKFFIPVFCHSSIICFSSLCNFFFFRFSSSSSSFPLLNFLSFDLLLRRNELNDFYWLNNITAKKKTRKKWFSRAHFMLKLTNVHEFISLYILNFRFDVDERLKRICTHFIVAHRSCARSQAQRKFSSPLQNQKIAFQIALNINSILFRFFFFVVILEQWTETQQSCTTET